MRPIDADALTKRLAYLWNVNDDSDFANKEVWHAVEEAPTIDVPERKVGKWMHLGGVFRCSKCEKCYPYATDHCPNCGARMNGEDDE